MADLILTQQATIIAYANSYMLLMVLTLAMLPMILIIGSSRIQRAATTDTHAAFE